MTAHALETSASVASLGALYERKSRFRVTPRFVFAVGVVAAAQVALGVYMAHVVFELPVEPWDEPTPINVGIQKIPVETPKRPPPPPKSEQPKPRQPALPVPTDGPTIPIPPVPPMPPPEPLVQGPPAPPAPPPPPLRQPTIANPKWLQRPTADQLARLYPSRAQRMDKTGQATLNCVVTPDGLMDKCQIASETPPDFGFGEAALRAARYFKISPPMSDGKPVEGAQIRIPIKFSLE